MTSIVHKAWMGLTGLFLVLFLTVHMIGNLQLFLPEDTARPSFNAYSHALTSNPAIKVASGLTYGSVLVHVVVAALLTRRNRRARRRGYATEHAAASSPWYARAMGPLGVAILAFLVWHLQMFWYRYHWGPIPTDAAGRRDLYTVVVTAFCEPWIVALYVLSAVAVGLHLQHGVTAGLRSLGVFSRAVDDLAPRWAPRFAWAIAGPFAAMPIYVYLAFGGQAP